jgi:integrase
MVGHVAIEKHTTAHGPRYKVRLRKPDGTAYGKTFRLLKDAQAWERAQLDTRDRGVWIDPAAGKLTIGAWAQTWRAGRSHLKPHSLANIDGVLNSRILPRWGAVALKDVRRSDIESWLSEIRAEGRSASLVRQCFFAMKAMLDAAVADGRIAKNPAAGVKLPPIRKADKRYLSPQQVAALADACGECATLVNLLAFTGLRWAEVAGLRVRHVDLLRGRLKVVEQLVDVRGTLVAGTPKSHAQRSVVVPRFLRDALAEQCAHKALDDLVFTSPEGGPLRAGNFRRRIFDRAAASVGLDGLTPHELRHTAASLMIASGATVKAVQAALGHASATLTLDTYADLFPDELDAVADRLDAVARAVESTPRADVVELGRQ